MAISGFLGIPSSAVRLGVVFLLLAGYTLLWVVWWRPWIMRTIAWAAKKRKHNEPSARKFATIAGTIGTFLFFVGYIPLGAILVRWFGLWHDPTVEGGKVWAAIGLAGAYIFQSHFFGLTLGGIKVLLLRGMKKGDYIELYTDYGVLWAAGTVIEIDTHGTKLRYEDGSVHTLPNEKVIQMDTRNFDHDKFHHVMLDIPLRSGELHTHIADQALAALLTLDSKHVAKLDDTDTKWYATNIEKYSILTAEDSGKITAKFEPGQVRIRAPIRSYIQGERIRHEAIAAHPDLFGRAVGVGRMAVMKQQTGELTQ